MFCLFFNRLSVYADTTINGTQIQTENNYSKENVEYQTVSESSEAQVFAFLDSYFSVTIPKVIVLSGKTKSATYKVSLTGDIAGSQTVNVVPDSSVTLYSPNKTSQEATITQNKTSWKCDEFSVEATGQISAPTITAGAWSNKFNFNISIDGDDNQQQGQLSLDKNNVLMGSNTQEQINAFYEGKNVNNKVQWSSDNTNITVNNGLIETKASAQVGDTATITATIQDTSVLSALLDTLGLCKIVYADDGSASASVNVTIIDVNFTDIDNNTLSKIEIQPGEEITVKANIIPENDLNINFSTTAISGINLVKNGNLVTVKVADDMNTNQTFSLIANVGNFSKIIDVDIIDDPIIYEGDFMFIGSGSMRGVNYTYDEMLDLGYITEYVGYNTPEKSIRFTQNGQNLEGKVILPENVYPSSYCFRYCSKLTDVILSNCSKFTYLETQTFYDCNLNYLVIPDCVTSIGTSVIQNCKINKLILPNNIQDISGLSLSCETEEIIIPSSCKKIANGVFSNAKIKRIIFEGRGITFSTNTFSNSSVEEVILPNDITEITASMFANCTQLKTITLPNSVKTISSNAFANCTSLNDLIIPNGVTSITSAFAGCENLTSLVIPDTVTYCYGSGMFDRCSKLETVVMSNNIVHYPSFAGCGALKSVNISDKTTLLNAGYFNDCSSLESIDLKNITTLKGICFKNCTSLQYIKYKGVTYTTPEEFNTACGIANCWTR